MAWSLKKHRESSRYILGDKHILLRDVGFFSPTHPSRSCKKVFPQIGLQGPRAQTSQENTLLATNIYPLWRQFWVDDFPFPGWWDMLLPWRVWLMRISVVALLSPDWIFVEKTLDKFETFFAPRNRSRYQTINTKPSSQFQRSCNSKSKLKKQGWISCNHRSLQNGGKNETNTIANKIGECECACNLHMGIGICTMIWKLLEHLKRWVMDLCALKHLHHWRHQPWRKGNHQLQASAAVPKWRQHQRRSGTLQMFLDHFRWDLLHLLLKFLDLWIIAS